MIRPKGLFTKMLMVVDTLHLLLNSQAKISILYSHLIIRKAKNISSFRGKVVWNHQILEEIRSINDLHTYFIT